MMELVKCVVIAVLLLTNVFCQELDVDNWREGIGEVRLILFPFVDVLEFVIHENKRHFNTSVSQKIFGWKKALLKHKSTYNTLYIIYFLFIYSQ